MPTERLIPDILHEKPETLSKEESVHNTGYWKAADHSATNGVVHAGRSDLSPRTFQAGALTQYAPGTATLIHLGLHIIKVKRYGSPSPLRYSQPATTHYPARQ